MGQRKTVRVFQLIAEDTIESKVLAIREWHLDEWSKTLCPEKRKDEIVAKVSDISWLYS